MNTAPSPTPPSPSGAVSLAALGLLAGLGVVVFFALYCWLLRLGDDLQWDEAYNLRVYARHPLVALALYWEPNNHVFETFLKSLFYGLGLDRPEFYKLGGFVALALYLAAGFAACRELWSRRSWGAAALLAVLLMLNRAAFDQALQLRGYFLSMAIALVYLALAARSGRWLEDEDSLGVSPSRMPPGRELLPFAALSALLLWTVPSNALLLPALWGAVAWPRRSPAAPALLRRAATLAALTIALTVVAYLPVAVGFLLDVNRLENIPSGEPSDLLAPFVREPALLLRLAAPLYASSSEPWMAASAAAALAVLSLAALLRGRRLSSLAPALLLISATLAASAILALVLRYPERAKTPAVIPLIVGAVLLAHAATFHASARVRLGFGYAALLLGLLGLPALARETRFDRSATSALGFLQGYLRADEHTVLICSKSEPLQLGLLRSFPDELLAQGELDLDLIFEGEQAGTELMKRAWLRRVRDLLLPPARRAHARPEDVDLLVFIVDEKIGRDPTAWEHPALTSIQQRLGGRVEFRQGFYRIVIVQ